VLVSSRTSPRRYRRLARLATYSAAVLLGHPSLIPEAIARLGMRRETSWRCVGLSPGYLDLRLEVAYGSPEARVAGDDLLSWLRWCRSWSRVVG
jgi:hypothetical protein